MRKKIYEPILGSSFEMVVTSNSDQGTFRLSSTDVVKRTPFVKESCYSETENVYVHLTIE